MKLLSMKSDHCLVAACIFITIAKSIQHNQAMTECLIAAWFKLLVTSDLKCNIHMNRVVYSAISFLIGENESESPNMQ